MNLRTSTFLLATSIVSLLSVTACGSASDVTLGGTNGGDAGDTGGDDIGPPPATFPRLFLASRGHGVSIWNNADRIGADRAADAYVDVPPTGAAQLALRGNRLFVTANMPNGTTADPVRIFDGASTLAGGASPSDTLPQSTFPSSLGPEYVQVDALGELWTNQQNGPWLVGDAFAVNHSTSAQAHFTHPWGQIGGFVYDTAGDKLLGGQISGAGALAWNAPRGKSGDGIASDWTLAASIALWSQTIADGRYWAADYNSHVYAWNDIASVAAAKDPDVTMELGTGKQTSSLRVTSDDVLVVTVEVPGTILLWKNAKDVTTGTPPTATITDPSIASSFVRGAILGKSGRLYVRDDLGVAMFDDPFGTPKFVARVTDAATTGEIATDKSFLLME